MYGLDKRVNRLIEELSGVLYEKIDCNVPIKIRDGKITFPCDIDKISDGYRTFENGAIFAENVFDNYSLFKFSVELPMVLDNEDLFLHVHTNQGGHNMLKPQMLLYVGDKAVQGLDTNHEYVRITDMQGRKKEFFVYAFSGLQTKTPFGGPELNVELKTDIGVRFFVSIEKRNKTLAEYVWNVRTAYTHLLFFDEKSSEYKKMLLAINESLSLVDMRDVKGHRFFESLRKANDYIKKELYEKEYDGSGNATAIGHTHIDLAWLWRYSHTKDKVLRSFATEVKLLKEFDEYKFMSSQAQLYEFIKEQDLELYNSIKDLVKKGKWEIEGSTWVEPDMNLCSGESLIRQLLYGKRYFKEEFGVDCQVLWLPDVFGYNAALPQILKKAGVKYFMTSKLCYNDRNRFPYDTFIWKGLDGSEVFAHVTAYSPYGYVPPVQNGVTINCYRQYMQKDINDDILMPFGYADGGGGPTEEQIESIRRLKNGLPGSPKVKFGGVKDYFTRLENKVKNSKYLPKWHGEIYFENHRGTYTSMAKIKKQNRIGEILYQNAEWLFVMADRFEKIKFPKEEFDKGMKNILLNQFHDVLPGTSIKEVYEDANKLYDEAFDIAERITETAISRIIDKNQDKITVFNPYSETVCGYVALDGERYFVEDVPAKGVKVFETLKSQPKVSVIVDDSERVVENQYYRLKISEEGYIESLYDKTAKRNCFVDGMSANKLRVFEDKCGNHEDNWNLDSYYIMHEFPMPAPKSIKVVKNTGEYVIVRIEREYEKSTIRQDIIVYARSPRIDFDTEIDWHESDQIMKAEFPVDVNAVKADYEIQYGYLERPTIKNTSWDEARFEVCAYRWADVSDGGYGVAILNDSKYGYSADGATLSITLLRCGTMPNPNADKGKHSFKYAILPHGKICKSEITKEASLMNNPLFARNGAIKNNEEFSLFSVKGAILDTIKPAENQEGYILRFYETNNSSETVTVVSGAEIKEAYITDLLENEKNDNVLLSSNQISFKIKPFEVVTIKVIFKD